MRFQKIIDFRSHVPDNRPRQQHTAGFPSDHTRTDHMVSYIEIVFRRKVLFHKPAHFFVPGHHNPAHGAADIAHIHMVIIQNPGRIEKPVPRVDILLIAGSFHCP